MSDALVVRHSTRRTGLLVLLALAIFVVAVLQAGLLRDLFSRRLELRVILPEEGLSGLVVGAPVQILGTDAGRVDDIVIRPNERFYAVVSIARSWEPFVRRDSTATIRKQFGIAGAAFLEISRGRGDPLDWNFAVVDAVADRSPTENVGQLVDDVRDQVTPIIEAARTITTGLAGVVTRLESPDGELRRSLADLATVSGRLARGEGTAGRLLADDTLARELETTLTSLNRSLQVVETVMTDLRTASGNVASTTTALNEQIGQSPRLVANVDRLLVSSDRVMRGVDRSMPRIDRLIGEAGSASTALPTLLAQTQQTFSEVERLLIQLRGSWLLGGSAAATAAGPVPALRDQRISPLEVRP